jgi:hypothetical protein
MAVMKKRADFHKVVIGRAEVLDFIEFGMNKVPAKVDTGAYRSAIHAGEIAVSTDGKVLSFTLLGKHPVCGAMSTKVSTPHFTQVKIANSFGHEELRYEVKLRVKLGPKVFWATFTLADRSKKIYPILIGRKMLNNRFMVDTARTSIDRVELKQRYGFKFPADEEEVDET